MRLHRTALVAFLIAFILGPLVQYRGLALMPADLGDTRLNNYFLENIFHALRDASSLWHLGLFAPYPWIGGFSDNLFGASLLYLVPRGLGMAPDTSFQVWFLLAFPANFASSYLALRRLGFDERPATAGALLYTFGLPVTAQSCHAQLMHRFAAPWAIVFFHEFLVDKRPQAFVWAGWWTLWQMAIGIDLGFFTLLVLGAQALAWAGLHLADGPARLLGAGREQVLAWTGLDRRTVFGIAASLLAISALFALLFYPYLMVTRLYGLERTAADVVPLLPRPASYLYSHHSLLWPFGENTFGWLPKHREHQMFVGLAPLFLGILGVMHLYRNEARREDLLIPSALAILVLGSLYVGGASLWLFVSSLPLFSAIRAVTRIVLILLFPLAVLVAHGVTFLESREGGRRTAVLAMMLLAFEGVAVWADVLPKSESEQRIQALTERVPQPLAPGSILFFAQDNGPFYADEIDAMWVALNLGVPTLNGYSGAWPPGFSPIYGSDCAEPGDRIDAFEASGLAPADYEAGDLARSLVLIGFDHCDESAWRR